MGVHSARMPNSPSRAECARWSSLDGKVERKGLTRARLHPFGVEGQARRIPSGRRTECPAGISTPAIQENGGQLS